ncbi:dicarboxylate/amino acid:cation symporter [Granulicella tundricola]|uniref:Sodium:dicarboxylate symporter n=1 Tax=Granulicella tundricola (strain ATCC BAA-1859 / DSM 23138 / MP5ACTX9) TaxID=1198114 RepID=E8WYI5_GRATM|nr:dicarboxylate/amino acid:cation symporter [Granulicella tundricola]ADW67583.1 sodium:dicarboxylate symporter [Granulicella tundricola MP5ACTX9]
MSVSLSSTAAHKPFYKTLYLRVLVGIIAGVIAGALFPNFGIAMKPFGDGFIKLIRMMIAPIIFLSVVVGIAGIGDIRKLGRVGVKALLYFEVVTTLALAIGLGVATLFQPGRGMNIDAKTLDTKSIAQYTSANAAPHGVDFVLNIIPDTFTSAFTKGEILQVLLLAILAGLALVALDKDKTLTNLADRLAHVSFKIIAYIMEFAPIGAFGAMAFTIGKYGLHTLVSLGKLLACVYLTSILFVVIVLGLICVSASINIFKLIRYLREELLIVLGTSSSETALPRMIVKMERLGCSKSVVGLVIPSGYSFNLDGTSIYLTIAALFIAQATNTHLTFGQQIFILFVLMLNSKGAAAVTGGGFITLAATLSALGTIPVAGITLLLGIDRFMSQMRSLVNLIGNGVATIIVAKWEGEFNTDQCNRALAGEVWHDNEAEEVVNA